MERVEDNGLVDRRTRYTRQRSKRAIRKMPPEPEVDGGGVTVIGNEAAVLDLNTREGIIV